MDNLKTKLIIELEKIAGLEHREWPDRSDSFSTLHYKGKEIAHFHHFNELDLRLGKTLIKQEGLKHHADSKSHPKRAAGSPYIELRFKSEADLTEVVRLVGLAVK